MTDQEKAMNLLNRASRVMSYPECLLCWLVADGGASNPEFEDLCERLAEYLKS